MEVVLTEFPVLVHIVEPEQELYLALPVVELRNRPGADRPERGEERRKLPREEGLELSLSPFNQ